MDAENTVALFGFIMDELDTDVDLVESVSQNEDSLYDSIGFIVDGHFQKGLARFTSAGERLRSLVATKRTLRDQFSGEDGSIDENLLMLTTYKMEEMVFCNMGEDYVNEVFRVFWKRFEVMNGFRPALAIIDVVERKLASLVFSTIDEMPNIDVCRDYTEKAKAFKAAGGNEVDVAAFNFVWDIEVMDRFFKDICLFGQDVPVSRRGHLQMTLSVVEQLCDLAMEMRRILSDDRFHIDATVREREFLKGLESDASKRMEPLFRRVDYSYSLDMTVIDLLEHLFKVINDNEFFASEFGRLSPELREVFYSESWDKLINRDKFTELRKRLGMSLDAVADACKTVDKNTLINFLYDKAGKRKSNKVRMGTLIELTRILRANPSDFIQYSAGFRHQYQLLLKLLDKLVQIGADASQKESPEQATDIRLLLLTNAVIDRNGEVLTDQFKEGLVKVLDTIFDYLDREVYSFEDLTPILGNLEKLRQFY